MIKHAAEITTLEARGYCVVPLGKGARNPLAKYRVRKGSRGRWLILDESELLELTERERAALERRSRRTRADV